MLRWGQWEKWLISMTEVSRKTYGEVRKDSSVEGMEREGVQVGSLALELTREGVLTDSARHEPKRVIFPEVDHCCGLGRVCLTGEQNRGQGGPSFHLQC